MTVSITVRHVQK